MPTADTITAHRQEARRAATRTALIDAAERCYARLGLQAATMADIAAEAGISRRTLYRHFANREQVLDAVIRQGIDRFWQQFHAANSQLDDFGDYLVEALVYALKHAPRTKTHKVLFDPAALAMVNKLYVEHRDYLRDQARAFAAVYARCRHRPGIRQDLDMLLICEWWNRLAVSFLATPSPFFRTEKQLRVMLNTIVAPVIRSDIPANAGSEKPMAGSGGKTRRQAR